MSRTLIYSFAGCAMSGASYLTPFEPGKQRSILGMNTDGVLRLLMCQDILLDVEQLAKLKKETSMCELHVNYRSLDVTKIKAIIWTSIPDSTFLVSNLRCQDKTMYPIHDGALTKIFGHVSSTLSIGLLAGLYKQLADMTVDVPYKIVVNYPTDHLQKDEWKQRINDIQLLASSFFVNEGWHVLAFEPELDSSKYWAHYSEKSRSTIWRKIAAILEN